MAEEHTQAKDDPAVARKRPKPGERRVQILQALASMLARKARRPVKLQYSREEEIIRLRFGLGRLEAAAPRRSLAGAP